MHWIKSEFKKKAKVLERETKKVRTQLRAVEQEGFFSDREMNEKERRMEELKSILAEAERELNLLWHLDKGGAVRSLQIEEHPPVGADEPRAAGNVAESGKG